MGVLMSHDKPSLKKHAKGCHHFQIHYLNSVGCPFTKTKILFHLHCSSCLEKPSILITAHPICCQSDSPSNESLCFFCNSHLKGLFIFLPSTPTPSSLTPKPWPLPPLKWWQHQYSIFCINCLKFVITKAVMRSANSCTVSLGGGEDNGMAMTK